VSESVSGLVVGEDRPGVVPQAVRVLGGGASVEGVVGGVYLQSLGQSSVPLERGALQVALQPAIGIVTLTVLLLLLLTDGVCSHE